ncbi:MAG: glycosyltransferase family 39 protein [Anaerolineae bacterium]|uniref:glycosyltransferase family 39 protein n=1 Tax=Candidatus Amarolinea dominans TaxID=3140696 RepID=UPI003136CCD7|nr:glycosyltransferase family 39 protein [Anaerolineae bacterium]
MRLIRVLSSLFGLLGLIAVYLTGRLIFQPGPSPLPALMMAVVGFVPTYTFAASVINNDILVGALGLWCIYFCALSVRSGVRIRSFALATICMALAFLTKYNGVILLPIVTLTGVVLLVRSWRAGNARLNRSLRPRPHHRHSDPAALLGLLRNKQLYGDYFINYPNMIQPFTTKISWLGAFTVPELVTRLTNGVKFTFMTFWGLLGADFVVLPEWLLNLLAILTGLVVVGIIYQRRVRRRAGRSTGWRSSACW